MNDLHVNTNNKRLETYPFMFTINERQFINTTTILERLSRKPHNLFHPHRTNFHMIYLFTEGEGTHMVDFNNIEVKKKHILFIAEGQVHAFDPRELYDGRALIFTDSFFCRSTNDMEYLRNSLLFNNKELAYFDTQTDYEELKALFIQIYDELNTELDRFQGELLHTLLKRMMLVAERRLERQLRRPEASKQVIGLAQKFKYLVDLHYAERKQVKYYADLLYVSQRTLQLATMGVLGKSPKEWIIERILLESKRMLAYEKKSIKEIAAILNFEDPTNFAKFFKKYVGLTPVDFRRKF